LEKPFATKKLYMELEEIFGFSLEGLSSSFKGQLTFSKFVKTLQ